MVQGRTAARGRQDDLYRHRSVHQVQIHGLRGGLSGRLLLCRPDSDKWVEFNRQYSEAWPNITRKGEAPADADDWKDVPGKLDKYFSPKPGTP